MSKESGFKTLLGESEADPKTTRSAALAQIAFERIGLFAAIFGFALLLVKVMRVSHLNSRTSQDLLTAVGPIEIILGTLVAHFPSILFAIGLLVMWWGAGSLAVLRKVTPAHAAAIATLLFAVMLLPWPFVVVLVAVGVTRYAHRSSRRESPSRRRAGYYLVIGAAAIVLIADAEPWMAPETFEMSDGSEFVGYAMDEAETSTGWIVILEQENRIVLRIPEEDVAAREPCHLEESDRELEHFPSLLQILLRESTDLPEPECPRGEV